MPPSESIRSGKFVEVDLDQVVDRDAEVLLDRLDRQRGAAEGVGGVDLVAAVARDVDHGVAQDRELRVGAAADAQEQDRVRPAGLADRLRPGLGVLLRAGVGAEHEDGVRAGQRVAAAAQLGVGRVGHVARLDLRADQEGDQRDEQPRDDPEGHVADHAADGQPPPATRLAVAAAERPPAAPLGLRLARLAAAQLAFALPWQPGTRAVLRVLRVVVCHVSWPAWSSEAS